MYDGDASARQTLVEYGFRLPSALDNRPLSFEEFEARLPQIALRLRHPGPLRAADGPGGWWSSRSSAPRASWTRGSRCGRRRARWTTCSARSASGRRGGARARHDPDQAHGRGPDRVLRGPRRPGALPPLRHRDPRAGAHPARPAPGRVRRPRRHQPAARGARPARGLARGHPRRGQGGLPALGGRAHPDRRARGPQRGGHGDPLRRPGSPTR